MQGRRPPPRRAAQRGVVAVMFALSLVLLVGFTGLALDGARLYINKAELQNAADACALAAAQELDPALPNFARAHAAGMLAATRNFIDLQSQGVPPENVTVEFAASANAAVWNLTGLALPSDLVARCTVAPPALALWFMPALGIDNAAVKAAAAASRNIAGLNCAKGLGNCQAQASLLQ
ncbi:pilus assembly protein TadG-related protein [uncultured Azohydromonas sp.]|jgi:Flp pilus assembly protein TadG|uniref:pilus assembly protein TadG-related protein n=1 Tax=uncultured Azohydromonas sp. TaxID=487342 RepID=UPI002609FAE5|nr:pilus assembly protein TadG-related protein [uncultured Azohydromonas sp.]